MFFIAGSTTLALGAAGLATGYLGAKAQSDAAQSAADTSANAAQAQIDTQMNMFNQTRADQAPWRALGGKAIEQLQANAMAPREFGMADYQADPGYGFRLAEGLKAIDRSAAARGGINSGRAMKEAQRYGEGLASQEYQNAFNRFTGQRQNYLNQLNAMAGFGQTANQANAQAGMNAANQAGQYGMTSAANQANAQLAAGNARSSMYSGLSSVLGNALGGQYGNIGSTGSYNGATPGNSYGVMANNQAGTGNLYSSWLP